MSDRFSSPQAGPAPEFGGKPTLPSPLAIATELWLVVVIGQAVAYAGQYPAASDAVRQVARDRSTGATAEEVRMLTSTGTVVGIYVAAGVVLALISLLVVWLARSGRNWARLVLVFFSAYIVVQTVRGLFADTASSWTTIPAVLSGVAALGAAWLLMQRDSEAYCRAMAAFRHGGSTGGQRAADGNQPPWPPQQYSPPSQRQGPPQNQQPGYDPSARYDPHAHDPRQQGPRYTPPPTGAFGGPPPLYPQNPPRSDDRPQPDRWEPAQGENVSERPPRRPGDTTDYGSGHSGRDDRGESRP